MDTERNATTTRRARRLSAALACALVLALVASIPAGAAQSTDEWADDVCGALLTFRKSVSKTVTEVRSATSLEDATAKARQGMSDAAQDLEGTLGSLERPRTQSGKRAQQALEDLSSELAKTSDAIQEALTPAPTSATQVAAAFAQIGTELEHAATETRSTAATLRSLRGDKELRTAFADASSCQELKSRR